MSSHDEHFHYFLSFFMRNMTLICQEKLMTYESSKNNFVAPLSSHSFYLLVFILAVIANFVKMPLLQHKNKPVQLVFKKS